MQTIASSVQRYQTVARYRGLSFRIFGLSIATVIPAALWAVSIGAIASWLGKPLSPQTILLTAIAIASFLAMVCAPIILRETAQSTS